MYGFLVLLSNVLYRENSRGKPWQSYGPVASSKLRLRNYSQNHFSYGHIRVRVRACVRMCYMCVRACMSLRVLLYKYKTTRGVFVVRTFWFLLKDNTTGQDLYSVCVRRTTYVLCGGGGQGNICDKTRLNKGGKNGTSSFEPPLPCNNNSPPPVVRRVVRTSIFRAGSRGGCITIYAIHGGA